MHIIVFSAVTHLVENNIFYELSQVCYTVAQKTHESM